MQDEVKSDEKRWDNKAQVKIIRLVEVPMTADAAGMNSPNAPVGPSLLRVDIV